MINNYIETINWCHHSVKLQGILLISSDRDDRIGAKSKLPKKSLGPPTRPKNIPLPENNRKKNPMPILPNFFAH